jgi:hypothetical protein
VVVAAYDNDTTTDIPALAGWVSGYDATTPGDQTLTVDYNSKTATYVVHVLSRQAVDDLIAAIDAIDIATLTVGDEDDLTDLKSTYDALTDFEKAAVSNKAKLDQALAKMQTLLFPAVDEAFLTGKVSIKADAGIIPYDAVLKVVEKEAQTNALATIQSTYGAISYFVSYFDITLEDANGNKIQPNGKLRISIKLDDADASGQDLIVVYVAADGTVSVLNATFTNGYAVFETDHLSEYAVVKKLAATAETGNTGYSTISAYPRGATTISSGPSGSAAAAGSPRTGDDSPVALWIVLMALCAAALSVVLVHRRRASGN